MYLPQAFREDRLEVQHGLIRTYPLGWLVTAGPSGLLANPVPFVLYPGEGERGMLRAHMARANPQLDELRAVSDCMVIFQGPHAYVTPSWYPSKQDSGKVVPTWNYATVHAWGAPRVMDGPDGADWLRRQIADLTRLQEAPRPAPWAVDDAPAEYVAAMIRGIVGVEIPIARIEGKWKVSQNRPEPDRIGVAQGLREQGPLGEPMAALVEAGKAGVAPA
jgi:transcriptional regulator